MLRIFLAASLIAAAGAATARDEPAPKPRPRDAIESRRATTLDELFTRLAAAGDETEANGIAKLIERRWLRSGSDTADLLMTRSGEAIKAEDYPLAVELLDRVIVLQPDWAEAWNRRATAFHQLDDPVGAAGDLRQALAREPRHFNAWAGLGHLLLANGDNERALVAFRRALAIHPHLEDARKAVQRLAPDVDGRDL